MRRFFYTPQPEEHDTLHITGSEAHHMATVLRLQENTAIELYDGKGGAVQGTILKISNHEVVVTVTSRTVHDEAAIPLTLVQAMLKGKKMDLLIQKATELGVQAFRPMTSRYCEKKNHNTRTAQRWHRIMLEACKQCGRPVPMTIHAPAALNTLSCDEASNLIMPWEDEDSRPLSPALLTTSLPTVLLIGPEGGFHQDEVTFARDLGFATVSFGPRILRAETAALAATAIVQYLSHNLNPAAVHK